MKKVKKIKFSLIALLLTLTFSSYSQNNQLECTVVSVIHLAELDYAILNQIGTQNYYETSPYPVGELTINQGLSLIPTRNNNFLVGANSLSINLYAELINNNNTNVSINQINLPRLENGILFFDSKAQYDITYDLIDNYMNQGDYDEMLDRIEATTPGFTSFRTWFNNEYNWLNGVFTTEELNRISKLDFVNDEIIKTLLNEDRLIGLGDTIYQYNSSKILLKFHKSNQDAINFVSTLKLDSDIKDVHPIILANKGIILENNGSIGYINLPINPNINPGGGSGGIILGEIVVNDGLIVYDSIKYISNIVTEEEGCDPTLRYIEITMIEIDFYTSIQNNDTIVDSIYHYFDLSTATITIDWDDSSLPEIITNYSSGTQISHNYPTSGNIITYYPTITIDFVDNNNNNLTIVDGHNTNGQDFSLTAGQTCIKESYGDWDDFDNGVYLIHYEIWIHFGIGNHIGSYTHSYKKVGNGWSRVKGNIWCRIDGVFGDNNCSNTEFKHGTKTKNNSKKVQKTKTKYKQFFNHIDGSINSGHYLNKDGYHLERSIQLIAC